MPTHKSNDYKLTAVQYYLVEDKTQEEVCKIFKCTPRSLMRWVERYKNEGNVNIHYRKPVAYKVKKEYVKLLAGIPSMYPLSFSLSHIANSFRSPGT